MNSIKELKEQLGYEEIGLDDIFVFHCTQCGKCCIHREDILLSPKDLFHIAKKLKITPEVALAQYCETYLGRNSHIPVVRLKPQGSVKRCPLLKNQKCLVHDVKPAVCAMFPIGRYLALPSDGIFPENPEELSVGYVFNDPECGDRSETHTVREWFHKFNIRNTFSHCASPHQAYPPIYIRTLSPSNLDTFSPTRYQSSPISIRTGTQTFFTFTSKHSPQCSPP